MRLDQTISWVSQLAKLPLSKRRYTQISPPFAKKQSVLDRTDGTILRFSTRGAPDWNTISQIFRGEEYCLDRLARRGAIMACYESLRSGDRSPLILDLGCNIGLTSRYFARDFPDATFWAIEPEAENCRLARENAPSADVRQAAVGAEDGFCDIINPDGVPDSFRVELSPTGAIPVVSMRTLLNEAKENNCVPFLLKVDIEGAESAVFRDADWLSEWPILMVELHDWLLPRQRTSIPVLRSILEDDRDVVVAGEILISLSNKLMGD